MVSYKWVKGEHRDYIYRLVKDLMGTVISQEYQSFEWYAPIPSDKDNYYENLYFHLENGGKV